MHLFPVSYEKERIAYQSSVIVINFSLSFSKMDCLKPCAGLTFTNDDQQIMAQTNGSADIDGIKNQKIHTRGDKTDDGNDAENDAEQQKNWSDYTEALRHPFITAFSLGKSIAVLGEFSEGLKYPIKIKKWDEAKADRLSRRGDGRR